MKKIILSLLVAGTISMNAQEMGVSKGRTSISGSFGYSSNDNGTLKSTNFGIAPSISYMVTDNIGLNGMIKYSGSDDGATVATKLSTFGFGVGASYFFSAKTQFSPYLSAAIGYGSNSTSIGSGASVSSSNINFGVTPGVNFFLNNRFALKAEIDGLLTYNSNSPATGSSTSNINFGLNMNKLMFGISYFIK
jgi:outer membrane protein